MRASRLDISPLEDLWFSHQSVRRPDMIRYLLYVLVLHLRACVWEEIEGPLHISRHVQMDLAFVVVSSHVYSCLCICFLSNRPWLGSVLGGRSWGGRRVLFQRIYAEVVYDKCELYWSRDVFPQPGHQFALEVSLLVEALFEEFVCKELCLW